MTRGTRGLNETLIGAADARQRLATPALVLDLDVLEHNIETMAAYCHDRSIALRPHTKTHKSLTIARMQVQAGASGVCVATLREAIVMVEGGIANVHVTSPIVGELKIEALGALLDRASGLSIVVDNPDNLSKVEEFVRCAGKTLPVLVDVDIKAMFRTGVAGADDAIALAQRIACSDVLEYAGVQYYSGIVQHVEKLVDRIRDYSGELERLARLLERLETVNLKPNIVTGGGTGTVSIDAGSNLMTENQAGSYVFLDVEYGAVELAAPFRNALFIQSTVVSNNARGLVTIDAGSKALATDGPQPKIASGAPLSAVYHTFGDEFGMVVFEGLMAQQGPNGSDLGARNDTYAQFHRMFDQLAGEPRRLKLDTRVELVVPHCDPTVNLHNFYHCMRGDKLVDIWPVDARGTL